MVVFREPCLNSIKLSTFFCKHLNSLLNINVFRRKLLGSEVSTFVIYVTSGSTMLLDLTSYFWQYVSEEDDSYVSSPPRVASVVEQATPSSSSGGLIGLTRVSKLTWR
ncbi:hypothetical protein YC2023_036317 [Brassica napus]